MSNPSLPELIRDQMPPLPSNQAPFDAPEWSNGISSWLAETSAENALNTFRTVLLSDATSRAQHAATTHAVVVGLIRRTQTDPALPLAEEVLEKIGQAYRADAHALSFRALLLRLLVASKQPAALDLFAGLLVSKPTPQPRLCLEIFGDLLKLHAANAARLFPQLLQGIEDPQLASFVLDYANFVFRQGFVGEHPAKSRLTELVAILSRLSERLGTLQEQKPEADEEARDLGRQVTEAVSLAVPLCDALGGIGDPEAIGCLNKALGVEHRRLRVEAAAALAQLGVEDAKSLLAAMAAEPVERLRVLQYAQELDILEQIDDEYSNIVARAEAEFVAYLAQPTQFGVAPQHVELLDQREMAWPGYEEPRNCYLFQFVYRFEFGDFSNIGIAGPLVRAIQADVRQLPVDDIYALFAGWHVDHPEIVAIPADRTVGSEQVRLQRLLQSLEESDCYQQIRPVLLAKLLDQSALIATADRADETGWVLVLRRRTELGGHGIASVAARCRGRFSPFCGAATAEVVQLVRRECARGHAVCWWAAPRTMAIFLGT